MVCATTGLLRRLEPEELEGVLAHELSHVAHRDVAVMTIASFLGVLAGLIDPLRLLGRLSAARSRDQQHRRSRCSLIPLVSAVVYAISFLLTRLLSRYRELSADRAAALLTGRPSALASALTKVTGEMARIPTQDLRKAEPFNAFFFAPALSPGQSLSRPVLLPPELEQRLEPARREISAAAGPPVRPPRRRRDGAEDPVGLLDTLLGRSKPVTPDLDQLFGLPVRRDHPPGGRRLHPDRPRARCASPASRAAPSPRSSRTYGNCSTRTPNGAASRWSSARTRTATPGCSPATTADDRPALVNDLHAVNTLLQDGGFGPQLLCSLVAFRDAERRPLALVYLYKRGTFYPFAPLPAAREARQRAGTPGQGAARGRPADRAGPGPLVPGLGRAGPRGSEVGGASGLDHRGHYQHRATVAFRPGTLCLHATTSVRRG